MILSIGMIVKNEEKYLDRCLTAMQPILDNVESELIIVDTGSTDNTVKIAKKHTDKVYFFEWINDFAAARNESLKYATGKWFMFVDADEIFENCDEIIKFFNSGEYKDYNCATFIQRNYTSEKMEAGTYGDFNAPRLSKITPETRFVLPVHEGFESFSAPIRIINAVANHFGYLHDDAENTIQKKHDRNAPLLLKRLETEEPRSLLYLQLFEAFYYSDPDKALEYLDQGLQLSLKEKTCLVPAFYKKKASLSFNNKDYEKAIEICDEYMNISDRTIRPEVTGSDGEFTSFKAHMLTLLERHDEAVKEYIRYFRLYRDFCSGKLDTPDLMMYELHYLSRDKLYLNHREFLFSCIKAKKYNTALEYLKVFPAEQSPDDGYYIYERIRNEVLIAENTHFKNLKHLHECLSEKHRDYLYRYIRARIFLSDNKPEYIKALMSLNSSESFKEIIGLINDYIAGTPIPPDTIKAFGNKYGCASYPELLFLVIAQNLDVNILSEISGFNAKNMSFSCCGDYEGFYELLANYDADACAPEARAALAKIYRVAIDKAIHEKENTDGLLCAFGRLGAHTAGCKDISEDEKAAAAAFGMLADFEDSAFKSCIAHMRDLLAICPETKPIITDYQKRIKAAIDAAKPENQLAQMAAAVKKNIISMIQSGNIDGAAATLTELRKLTPDDPELGVLEQTINSMEK